MDVIGISILVDKNQKKSFVLYVNSVVEFKGQLGNICSKIISRQILCYDIMYLICKRNHNENIKNMW